MKTRTGCLDGASPKGSGVEKLRNPFVPFPRLSNERYYRWYPEHDKKYSHDLHIRSPSQLSLAARLHPSIPETDPATNRAHFDF
jgi:hypothetical protein